jgi:integrase
MAKKFTKLHKNAIAAAKAGTTIYEHGIEFKRMANGDGVYTVNVMVDGRRVHRTLGRESEGVTRSQADAFIEQARTDARLGRLNLPKGRKTVLRFGAAATSYLALLEEEGGKDIQKKAERLKRHLTPFFKDAPLSAISSFEVQRYKKQRLAAGAKAGTVNRELAVLSHLLNKAVEWKWMTHRPAQIKRLPEGNGRIEYLSVEECERLIQCAAEDSNPHLMPFVRIALGTSMRKTEVLSLRREHVQLDRRVLYVPKAKSGAREQPITAEVAEFLRQHIAALPDQTPWLFPSKRSRSGYATGIEEPFRRAVRAAGLDPKRIVRHTMRHTAVTHLVQSGVDLPTVQRISGHKTLAMVARYAHANGAHIQAAMDVLERRYSSGQSKTIVPIRKVAA